MPKVANSISTEVELVLNEKEEVASARGNILNDQQIEKVTHDVIRLVKVKYPQVGEVSIAEIIAEINMVF